MTHRIAASNNHSIADSSRPSNENPTGRGRPIIETGVIIARIVEQAADAFIAARAKKPTL